MSDNDEGEWETAVVSRRGKKSGGGSGGRSGAGAAAGGKASNKFFTPASLLDAVREQSAAFEALSGTSHVTKWCIS